jgi:outer membrane protein assembly factor BamB
MKETGPATASRVVLAVLGIVALILVVLWLSGTTTQPLALRVPGTDRAPGSESGAGRNAVLAGELIRGDGQPANLPGSWPQFRGPMRDNLAGDSGGLLRTWQPSEPHELWGTDVGEGYAGPAVLAGRVYLMDYDREKRRDALRCLSLDDGREIWRFSYPVPIKRNHGMSRTVPAVTDRFVVAIGPKCHVVCVDAVSGELRWGLDLVRQYGATIPPWYAGQCPLIDRGQVILGPGGKDALLIALDLETGKETWRTPNPRGWKMTHSSIMPMAVGGDRFYVYCANNGVVGVSARDGSLLWETRDWKISLATVPSPLMVPGDRVFLSGGYNAGSLMLQLKGEGARFTVQTVFKLEPEIFGATQQTPICYENHIYGVRPDGRFVCLTLDGKTVWASEASQQFGLGPFLLAEGMIFGLNDSGLLRLIEASPQKYTVLGQAQVLKGRESWAPLALVGTRLLARDLTRLVCLEVGKK